MTPKVPASVCEVVFRLLRQYQGQAMRTAK